MESGRRDPPAFRPIASRIVIAPGYREGEGRWRPVVPEELYSLIDSADRLVVKESPSHDAKTLYESREREDLDDLQESLVIELPEGVIHCRCTGTPAIYLYKADELILCLTNHHANSVRCALWTSDFAIMDRERWLTWFDKRKISGPRRELEEVMHALGERGGVSWHRWVAAMPVSIKPLWMKSVGPHGDVNVAPLIEAMAGQVPDRTQRILMLLEWFGSGAGDWSIFPAYEQAAEEMLLEFETEEITSAMESTTLTEAQTEGAARLLAGSAFSEQRPNALEAVPEGIMRLLWDHAKRTVDFDKLGRARRAFTQ